MIVQMFTPAGRYLFAEEMEEPCCNEHAREIVEDYLIRCQQLQINERNFCGFVVAMPEVTKPVLFAIGMNEFDREKRLTDAARKMSEFARELHVMINSRSPACNN